MTSPPGRIARPAQSWPPPRTEMGRSYVGEPRGGEAADWVKQPEGLLLVGSVGLTTL